MSDLEITKLASNPTQLIKENLNPEKKYLFYKISTKLKELVDSMDEVIETKQHYLIKCPCCEEELDYHESKLYILKDYSKGYCQRCQSSFFDEVEKLDPNEPRKLSDFKVPRLQVVSNLSISHKLDKVDPSYYNSAKVDGDISYLDYRYSKEKFISEVKGIPGVIYRTPKYKLSDYVSDLKIRFRVNRVVVPYFWMGELIYYQIRFTDPYAKPKYHNPVIDSKPIYDCPFNRPENKIGILVEGVFGAIAVSFAHDFKYNTYATMGSYLTDYQHWMLKQLGLQKLVLYYDDWSIGYNIFKNLMSKSPIAYKNTEILRSPCGDPETDYLAGIKHTIHDVNWIYKKK